MTNEEINVAVAEKVMGWTTAEIAHAKRIADVCKRFNEEADRPMSQTRWRTELGLLDKQTKPGRGIMGQYATSAADDCSVLAQVRETWNNVWQERFVDELAKLLRIRRGCEFSTNGTIFLLLFGNGDTKGIQVGDFSRAALSALEAK